MQQELINPLAGTRLKKDDGPCRTVTNILKTARMTAGLGEDATPDVVGRQIFASRLRVAGVDLRTIQELGR